MLEVLLAWPARNRSRVPYEVFTHPDVFGREQEAIFRGSPLQALLVKADVDKALVKSAFDTLLFDIARRRKTY